MYAAGANGTQAPQLQFVVNDQAPPFGFVSDGQPDGEAVELTRAAVARARLDVKIEALDWAQAQQTALNGAAAVVSHINRTPQREIVFGFSELPVDSSSSIFAMSVEPRFTTWQRFPARLNRIAAS